jgi:hypothetical protein
VTADRNPPTLTTTPAGMAGAPYADRIAEEILALYKGRVNQVTSVGGTANAITGVCTPPLTGTPTHGETFRLTPGANNTNAVQINLDGVGLIDLRDEDGAALAADDIVSGRAITYWYDSVTSKYRLHGTTLNDILAALAANIAAASLWEVIDDTTISSAQANVEHLFTADDYTHIKMVCMGISSSASSNTLNISLRYSGGSILNLPIGSAGISNGNTAMITGEFYLDLNSATRQLYGRIFGQNQTNLLTEAEAAADSVNIPDRVRVAYSSGNVDAGRIVTYGLKKPA